MATKCEGFHGYFYTDNVFLFIPNIIDYMRVVFLAVFVYYACLDNYIAACISYVASVSLDELDGNSARYFNQTSLFGMIIDILIDEATVLCLCMVLSTLYPKYIIVFQLYTVLDIAGQWTNYQYAAMYRNNNFTRADDWLLNMYFNKKIYTNLWVYGNHVFLLMLYLCFYTREPEIQVLGSTISIWKVLVFTSAPWSISRLCIMLYLLVSSLSKIAHEDILIRRRRNLQPQETEDACQRSQNQEESEEKSYKLRENCVSKEFDKKLEGFEHERKIEGCPLPNNEEFISRIISANNIITNEKGYFCKNCKEEFLSKLFLTRRTGPKNASIFQQHYSPESAYCCNLRPRNTCYSMKVST